MTNCIVTGLPTNNHWNGMIVHPTVIKSAKAHQASISFKVTLKKCILKIQTEFREKLKGVDITNEAEYKKALFEFFNIEES